MPAERSKQSHQQRAIEILAREAALPIDEVTRLYEVERAGLGVGAHITAFLPIFAVRNVRKALRQRASEKRVPK